MATHFASIDLEDWYSDVEGLPGLHREEFYRQYSSIVECLSSASTKCTFFVLGKTAERYPKLISALYEMGHEVASHGHGHQRVDRLTPNQFEVDLERSVGILAELTGVNPLGYRAPYFSITRDNFWVYDILVNHGFHYSSSIFPFHGNRYGVGDFPVDARTMTTPLGRTITEYPMAVAEIFGKRVPIAGGGFWRVLPSCLIRAGIRHFERSGRTFTMYLHPHEFDPRPLRSGTGMIRDFYVNCGRSSVKGKFIKALRDFEFKPFRGGRD